MDRELIDSLPRMSEEEFKARQAEHARRMAELAALRAFAQRQVDWMVEAGFPEPFVTAFVNSFEEQYARALVAISWLEPISVPVEPR